MKQSGRRALRFCFGITLAWVGMSCWSGSTAPYAAAGADEVPPTPAVGVAVDWSRRCRARAVRAGRAERAHPLRTEQSDSGRAHRTCRGARPHLRGRLGRDRGGNEHDE